MKVSAQLIIKTPVVPNFIIMQHGARASVSVADLDDAVLRAIGKEWTAALIENARKLRKRRVAS